MSMRSLRENSRASLLGLPFLVLHPGAHMGRGVEADSSVVASLDAIMDSETRTRIALETTAGGGVSAERGTGLHPAQLPRAGRLCVCIDTAHLFAAGYELGVRRVLFARSLNSKKSSGSTGRRLA
jgi:deoxyribonuclease-4